MPHACMHTLMYVHASVPVNLYLFLFNAACACMYAYTYACMYVHASVALSFCLYQGMYLPAVEVAEGPLEARERLGKGHLHLRQQVRIPIVHDNPLRH